MPEMEMKAGEDIDGMGQDLTPQIPPLSFSLFDSFIHSHCSSCSRPLPPLSSQNATNSTTLFYCSSACSSTDSPIHHSSAEHHLLLLLQSHTSTSYHNASSDLRAALRLLLRLTLPRTLTAVPRLSCGLLTNFEKFHERSDDEEEDEFVARIKEGGRLMARARRMRDGREDDVVDDKEGFNVVEEMMALCAVITNAVEFHADDEIGAVGIAVYGPDFSWINHSCSPNACYRFSVVGSRDFGASLMRIVGSSADEFSLGGVTKESNRSNNSELGISSEIQSYGPRVIVRSIKPIMKGEEVCVTYTDLLQPKAIRRSELWLRYKFICQCQRCASTPCYVDHVLQVQESIIPNLEELSGSIDEAISDYLSLGNPEPCIEKLENILAKSFSENQSQTQHSLLNPMLHPLHHLSLNAFITLSSAYRVQAKQFLASYSEIEILTAFELNRASTAYSLLIAGGVHHLFLSEFSLIATAANFWISVGESLLNLSRSRGWTLTLNNRVLDFRPSLLAADGHYKCPLLEKLAVDLNCQEFQSILTKTKFHEISEGFIHCVSKISSKAWVFMIRGRRYLKDIKDPIDFSWLFNTKGLEQEIISENCTEEEGEEERIRVFQLSVHCLLYGAFLLPIIVPHISFLIVDNNGHMPWTLLLLSSRLGTLECCSLDFKEVGWLEWCFLSRDGAICNSLIIFVLVQDQDADGTGFPNGTESEIVYLWKGASTSFKE